MKCLNIEEAKLLDCLEICKRLQTNDSNGLDKNEANSRLRIFGYNEFNVKEEESIFSKYIEQFKNPLILLLLASASISVIMGQFDDAISITVSIVIVVTVAFIQEYRSEKSLEELNKLVPPICNAIRDGTSKEFLARFLVPGDLVTITTGSRVPADLRLIEVHDLQIDESSFTGETEPCHKHSHALAQSNGLSPSLMNMNTNIGFMGTLVRSGHGKGIVISTGENSAFGAVFKLMQSEESPKTPLQKSMDSLGKQLSIYSLAVIIVIMLLGWIQSRSFLEMLNIGVSLAVAAIPEGLPIVVTVTLALGVLRMSSKKCIVKKLPTVETLGCVNVICSDKTGTLTTNQQTATSCVTADLQYGEFSGIGYTPFGELKFISSKTPSLNGNNIESFIRIFQTGILCNNAQMVQGKLIGQPTEGAIVVGAEKLQINVNNYRKQFTRLEEMPFDSAKKIMVVKCRSMVNYTELYHVKGTVENVLKDCVSFYDSGKYTPLTDELKNQYIIEADQVLARKGLRVLAFSFGEQLNQMVFLGMVGIHDPPRLGVQDSVKTLKDSGVQVKMITGDSEGTATSIGLKIGILDSRSANCVMSGEDLDRFTDKELEIKLPLVSIFYRTTPAHKLKIVKILQRNGYIVGMTGDGVNDGIALKKADIGISMGKTGTDVCKEAADMILVDDNFNTIMAAIEEGKSIYSNIQNFVCFQLSTSIAALSLIAISTLLRLPKHPLNPMQILWINILMDGPPALSISAESVDHDVLKQPPRNVKTPMINLELIINVLISSFVIICGTLFVFVYEMSDGQVNERDQTMTFTCFVLFDMFNALSCRSQTKSVATIGLFTNRAFTFSVAGSLIGQFLVIYSPLCKIFDTVPLTFYDICMLLLISSTVLIVSEVRKFYYRRVINMKKKKFHYKKDEYV